MDMSVQCNMAERRVSAGRNIPSLFLSLFFDLRKPRHWIFMSGDCFVWGNRFLPGLSRVVAVLAMAAQSAGTVARQTNGGISPSA